jgi:hypothetical protein
MKQMTKPKVKRLIVPYDDARALLASSGYKAKWTREKVQQYFDRLPEKVVREDVEDEDLLELYLDACACLSAGGSVEIEPPQEVAPGPEPAPSKPPKAAPAPKGRSRPGVCKTALELCEAASKKRPMTADRLYELLRQKFPDRENPGGMKSTADRFKYWAPYYYRVELHESPAGFWITRDYQGDYQRVQSSRKRKKQ